MRGGRRWSDAATGVDDCLEDFSTTDASLTCGAAADGWSATFSLPGTGIWETQLDVAQNTELKETVLLLEHNKYAHSRLDKYLVADEGALILQASILPLLSLQMKIIICSSCYFKRLKSGTIIIYICSSCHFKWLNKPQLTFHHSDLVLVKLFVFLHPFHLNFQRLHLTKRFHLISIAEPESTKKFMVECCRSSDY